MARLPDQIGKYDVVERIGKGGMGMVYKARHPTLDRYVILKKLTISGDAAIRERFRREAEIMIDFRTDYVVDVYDHFKQGSNDYIVLEYVEGIALDELLENERYLDTDLALLIARDCFRGLDYVHGKGVVHRDVKPGNVLIGRDGAVKLLDFGIASRVTAFEDELTREGMTLGTVAYIAPEQIERSRDVDRRADVYSAGAMLYEMVTGRKAFSGGFNPETVNRIQRGRYRRPRRVNPRVSPLASRVITRCMRRKPRRRYQSAGDVVRVLDAYFRRRGEADLRARLAGLAGGEPAAPPVRRARRRSRWLVTAAVVVVLVGAAVAGWATGTIQRLVLAHTHALAQIEVRLRKSERTVGEHLVRAELFRIVDGAPTPVPVAFPLLHEAGGLETPDFVVLRSRLLTLPVGRYEAHIRVEDSATRETRSLLPVAVEASPQLLTARWDPAPDDELDVDVTVSDAETGNPLPEAKLELER
ncbi:MAG: serine/threonine protein kinase, partial [Spirochaetota bacterium]